MSSFNRRPLGYVMAATPFVGMFVFTGLEVGWWLAIACAGIVIALTVWMMIAADLSA